MTTGISNVNAPSVSKVTETYDLSGRRVSATAGRGVYILRTADGKVIKVARK